MVRMLHPSWGKCCLLIAWAMAACGSHATVAVPTGAPSPRVVEERLLDQISQMDIPETPLPSFRREGNVYYPE